MAKQTINIGTLADDGTGDTLRASLDKCNDNFTELYALTDGTGAASVLTLAAGSTSLGDTTIADATPILIFKDSSCTDADNNATILVAATDTGTGAEDIDVTLTQQVAGVVTNFLVSDADGSITLGDGARALVLSGAVTSGDATISDATPQLSFRDSSCAVARDNAYLLVAATDTGDGTEDADVTLYQHVAGSATAFLTSDADGSLTVGRSGQAIVLNGAVGDITMKDSTPVLAMIDTDAVDGDAGVSITATCTTVTAGAEHVDATFAQQVAGSPVNFLMADADGSITLGDGTRPLVLSGTVGDVTIKDATPVLNFKDSSCAVSDVNAYIEATATDTGDGSEDIDVAIYQQVAGNMVACFTSDADGSVALGYNGQPAILNSARVQGATPTFRIVDTDAVDVDEGVTFTAACTTVTAGAEDVDFTISQQVGGSPVTFLNADADSLITIGDGTRNVYVVKLTALSRVVANTGTETPSPNESGSIITNEGDADGSTILLPTAVAGLQFTGVVQVAQTLTVTANTADTIRVAGLVTAAAGSITSAIVGSTITLTAINDT
jgi:hypothetical protein